MKRGQCFVLGQRRSGKWDNIDVLDLDEESFRAFVLEKFCDLHVVVSFREEAGPGETIIYKEK